jgi:acetolactate synthase-1/3 small subunit
VIDQIQAQLDRMVPVHKVSRPDRRWAACRARTGAGQGGRHRRARVEALRLAEVFRAKVVDTTMESFVFEITGTPDKIDRFIELMRELGLVEVGRTGVVGDDARPERGELNPRVAPVQAVIRTCFRGPNERQPKGGIRPMEAETSSA